MRNTSDGRSWEQMIWFSRDGPYSSPTPYSCESAESVTVIFAMFVFFEIKSRTVGFDAAGSATLLDQLFNFEFVTVPMEGYKVSATAGA